MHSLSQMTEEFHQDRNLHQVQLDLHIYLQHSKNFVYSGRGCISVATEFGRIT